MIHDACMLTFYRIQVTFFHTMSIKTLGFKLDPANLPAIQGADLRSCFCFIWSETKKKKIGQWSQFTTYPKPTSGTDFCDEIDLLDQKHNHNDVIFIIKEVVNNMCCYFFELWCQALMTISLLIHEDICLAINPDHNPHTMPWAGRNFANN